MCSKMMSSVKSWRSKNCLHLQPRFELNSPTCRSKRKQKLLSESSDLRIAKTKELVAGSLKHFWWWKEKSFYWLRTNHRSFYHHLGWTNERAGFSFCIENRRAASFQGLKRHVRYCHDPLAISTYPKQIWQDNYAFRRLYHLQRAPKKD